MDASTICIIIFCIQILFTLRDLVSSREQIRLEELNETETTNQCKSPLVIPEKYYPVFEYQKEGLSIDEWATKKKQENA